LKLNKSVYICPKFTKKIEFCPSHKPNLNKITRGYEVSVIMSRLLKEDKEKLFVKHLEFRVLGKPDWASLFAWVKGVGSSLLSRIPHQDTVRNLVKKWVGTTNIDEAVRDRCRTQTHRGGKSAPVTAQVKAMILRKVKDTRRTRSKRRIEQLAKEYHAGRQVSTEFIRLLLHERGLGFRLSRDRISLKPHHINVRLLVGRKWQHQPASFWRKFIFSDEKTFRARPHRHRKNDGLWIDVINPREADTTALTYVSDRYSASVSVWGGVSYSGKLKLDFVVGSQDEKHYCAKVVKGIVKPFMLANTAAEVFQQDGAAIHTSDYSIKQLNLHLGQAKWTPPPMSPCKKIDSNGNVLKEPKLCKDQKFRHYAVDSPQCYCSIPEVYFHPAKSPDLNIMENIWAWMVAHMADQQPANTHDDLIAAIGTAWRALPMDYVETLFDSIPTRLSAVVAAEGQLTRY
jgi:hypothetical protein